MSSNSILYRGDFSTPGNITIIWNSSTPPPPTLNYIVPMYQFPSGVVTNPTCPTTANWYDQLVCERTAVSTRKAVNIYVILNPQSGAFTVSTPPSNLSNFLAAQNAIQSNAMKMIGYVDVGTATVAAVEANVDAYNKWFPGLDGIFLDNWHPIDHPASDFSAITTYIHNSGLKLVYGNCNDGTAVTSAYIGTADVINNYENSGLPTSAALNTNTIGIGGTPSQWGMIAYSVSSLPAATGAYPSFTAFKTYVNWVYVTDQSNTYNTPPSYEGSELDNIVTAG